MAYSSCRVNKGLNVLPSGIIRSIRQIRVRIKYLWKMYVLSIGIVLFYSLFYFLFYFFFYFLFLLPFLLNP